MNFLNFQIASLFYVILLSIVYFSKKRATNVDNKIFSLLIVVNFAGVILDIVSTSLAFYDFKNVLLNPISKVYLIYMISWLILFTIYVVSIANKNMKFDLKQKWVSIVWMIYILFVIAIAFLPLYNYSNYGRIYTYGPSVLITYFFAGICSIIWIISLIINRKNLKNKKYIPLLAFAISGLSAGIIQFISPETLIITFVLVFINFLMYFTIENPDMKMIEQLNIAKDEAVKANMAKSDFLSNMSHEIRTPLNAIVGFSQALETENLPDSAKEEVGDIISASESLLEIVNGILDISKIEANKLDIINNEYSFKKIFNDLVSLTKARMGDSKLEFRYSMDETIPPVLYGDHSRVKQVILNLLTNAVKYTKEGYLDFKVSSIVKDNICRLIISVEDSGIGIKKESLNKLFSKFERLGVEREITIEGTGLGLAITKKLVDLMKGEIVVQSVYGKGSRFTIALDQRIIIGKDELFEEVEKELTLIDCTGKKILVVDDNMINLKVASRLLVDYKATIETVSSGFECINKIELGDKYDLILMDDMMPKMSGTETLHKLQNISGFNIPVVSLTANAISGMREKYLSEGFNEYLAKPIQKNELNIIINKFLGQKQ